MVPSPTMLIFPADGPTAPPAFPVIVETKDVPPLPTVPSWPVDPINTGIPSVVAGVIFVEMPVVRGKVQNQVLI